MRRRYYKRCSKTVLVSVLTLLMAPYVNGSDSKGSLSLALENDLFGAGTDKHYTHGTEISYASDTYMPHWFESVVHLLPFAEVEHEDRFSWAVGQKMYTPKDIEDDALILDDRPYAGWLYASFGLIAEDVRKHQRHIDSVEIIFGLVGPNSGAEAAQKRVHQLIGSPEPKGWEHQLKHEYTFDVRYRRAWLIPLIENRIDILPSAGFTLGSSQRFLNGGIGLRLGSGLNADFGPPVIRPNTSGTNFFKSEQSFYWYFFIGAYGRYVDYSIFLDGNRDANSHGVERLEWMGDAQTGLVMGYGDWRFTMTNIYRTREFESQDEPDEFGSLVLSYRF